MAEIVEGYSRVVYQKKTILVKHFSGLDQAIIDYKFNDFLAEATKKGVITEEQKVKTLIRDQLWTEEEDKELENLKLSVAGLRSSQRKQRLPSKVKEFDVLIKAEEEKIVLKSHKKQELIGYTAETFANRKINALYIYNSLFKDDKVNPYFSQQDFDDIDQKELNLLINLYQNSVSKFQTQELKKIAINNFFLNSFYLCNDDPYIYYGKAVCSLTFYQTELFSFAKYFKYILSENGDKIPNEIKSDPELLDSWFTSSKNIATNNKKESESKSGKEKVGSAETFVGATQEDLKALGMDKKEGIQLSKIVGDKKKLSMKELMAAQGIK